MNRNSDPLDRAPAEGLADRIDVACDKFEAAWLSGQRPRIEEHLAATQDEERRQLLRELIALDIDYRIRHGEYPCREDYADQLQEVPGDLSTLFAQADEGTATFVRQAQMGSDELDPVGLMRNPGELDRPQLGDYIIESEIARGGMGIVYRARQQSLNRTVALKTISSGEFANDDEVIRFRNEAESAARLDHPGIVPVYEVGEADGRHYFSMGLVEGGSLAEAVTSQPYSHGEVARIVFQICGAVAYAHGQGVIHRDLKPGNVLIDGEGEPRITDFGLAKQIEQGSNLTVTGQVLGTPSYMAPEQAAGRLGEIGETSDVYSIGAILYALLCGRPPFQSANVMTTLQQVLEQDPVQPRQFDASIPVDLDTICLKCLEKDPRRRYQSAKDLADELQRFQTGHPIQARPLGMLRRWQRWAQRNPLVATLWTVSVLSLVIGLCVSTYFAVLARSREGAARQGTTMAMATLDSVIHDVHSELQKVPGARTIRRDLLKRALADLQQVPTEFLQQSKRDRDTAQVLRNLGEIMHELGDEEASADELAEDYYLRSIDILQELVQAEPSDHTLVRQLALSNEFLGDLYLELNRPALAQSPLSRNLELCEELVLAQSENTTYQFARSYAYTLWGDVHGMAGRHRKALDAYRQASQYTQQLLDQHPGEPNFLEQHAANLEKIGDSQFDMGKLKEAAKAYEQSNVWFEELYAADPTNLDFRHSVSTSCERVGNLLMRLRKLDAARQMFEREVELSRQTVETDPTNLVYQRDLAVAYQKLAQVATAQNDTAAARQARQQAADLRQSASRATAGQ